MNDKYSWEDHLDKIIKERKEGEAEIARLRQHLKMYEAECSSLREAGFENAQDLFTSYEGLRRQRDMAVKALNKSRSKMEASTRCHPKATVHLLAEAHEILEEALSAIQSKEGKE